MKVVEHLKKITLSLEAGTSTENMDLRPGSSEYEFIFGLSPTGMSPFEYELINKKEGDEILIHLKRKNTPVFFEHLHLPLGNLFRDHKEIVLNVKIQKIDLADNREVVKAMADMTAHAHGCDCGCGC
ncbi:MAG: hypothetical protein JSV83_20725 [Desulfobacterales bacterium]|nr:MAG: hypothetical protein JSV83_20725 [Desulfobacterales bacterium]